MADLFGLSPEEISGVSARRTATDADRYKMAGMLINMMGAKQQADINREKLELLKNPPMVQIKIADQIYEIPKGSQLEGAKAKAEVEERYRTGTIDQAQHDAWMKPVVTSLPRGDGGWVEYEVPSGMLQSMASGIKSLQEVRVSGVEQERKRKAVEALGCNLLRQIPVPAGPEHCLLVQQQRLAGPDHPGVRVGYSNPLWQMDLAAHPDY